MKEEVQDIVKLKTRHSGTAAGFMFRLLVLVLLATLAGQCAAESRSEEVLINASLGKMYGILTIPETEGKVPLIIISHGFDGTHADKLDYADYFTRRGFATYSPDFCGGGGGSLSAGTMLEMSVLTEAEDLNAAVDHFLADSRFSCIMLWGSSQGGLVNAYMAAGRSEDIRAMVLEFPAFVIPETVKAMANPDGSFPETAVLRGVLIGRRYMEDATAMDCYDRIKAYTGPVLLLHGDADDVVPLSYSERARETFENAELIIYPGQGHDFTGEAAEEAKAAESAFFAEHAQK